MSIPPKSNLFCHHIFDPLYPLLLPSSPPSLWEPPHRCLCLWVFVCLVCSFVAFSFICHICVKSYGCWLFPSDLFHLAHLKRVGLFFFFFLLCFQCFFLMPGENSFLESHTRFLLRFSYADQSSCKPITWTAERLRGDELGVLPGQGTAHSISHSCPRLESSYTGMFMGGQPSSQGVVIQYIPFAQLWSLWADAREAYETMLVLREFEWTL